MSLKNNVETQVKKIYLSIKNDDLETFKSVTNKEILLLKNHKKNNLLFYCLEKNSLSIFNYIYKFNPNLVTEKNIDGFNCFTNLINKKSFTNLNLFLNSISEDLKKKLINSYDLNNNNLLVQFMKKGESYYELYNKHFKKHDQLDSTSHVNNEGQNIAHLIAYYDCFFSTSLLENSHFNKLSQKDNKGVTPLLMAAKHSSFKLFELIASKSSLKETSDLDSNALHFASYSGNVEKLNYLIVNGLDPDAKNKYLNSPLFISLVEKKYDCSLELLKKVKTIEFEDLIHIVKASEKFPELYDCIINKVSLFKCMDTLEKKQKFSANLFYYGSQTTIEKSKHIISTLFKDDIVLNSLFFSSIAGRRDFLYKTNYLINNFGWVNANNEVYVNFLKEQSCGYVYALYQLPKTQLEYLTNKSFIYENMSDKDKIIFKVICISKNSSLFLKEEKYNFNLIKDDTNLIKIIEKISIEKILDNLDFFQDLGINLNLKEILKNNLAQYIYKEKDSIKSLRIIYNKLKDKNLKKDIYLKLNELFLNDDKPHLLEKIFNNKFTIMEKVLNNMLENKLENFNNINYVINNEFINLSHKSCFNYIKENNFSKKSIELISKSSNFLSYLKNVDISSENYLGIDMFKLVMKSCSPNERVTYLSKFIEYSFFKENIHINTYNYFYNQLSENDQKLLIKTTLPKFLKKDGFNVDIYNFLEKKYKQFYSGSSFDKILMKYGKLEKLFNRVIQNYNDFNIFKSNYFKQFSQITLLNKKQFDNDINLLFSKVDNFCKHSITDLLSSNLQDEDLSLLTKIINMSNDNRADVYKKVLEKLENFSNKNNDTYLYYQEIINNMLFTKNQEIQNLVIFSESIKNGFNKLTQPQRKFLFSTDLENKLEDKKETVRPVKI